MTHQQLTILETNTESSMTYFFRLYFDGRKYTTMINLRSAAGYGHRDRVGEENVGIICEPGLSYYGYVMSLSASSKASSKDFF